MGKKLNRLGLPAFPDSMLELPEVWNLIEPDIRRAAHKRLFEKEIWGQMGY